MTAAILRAGTKDRGRGRGRQPADVLLPKDPDDEKHMLATYWENKFQLAKLCGFADEYY